MEVDDVLADEVDLLRVGCQQKLLEAAQLAPGARLAKVEVTLQRGEIADRRIQPDIEILPRRIRNRDAEVGRVARDVPVAQHLLTGAGQPFARLVGDLRLQPADPRAQELDTVRIREFEEEMIRGLEDRRRARQGRVGVDEVRRRIHRAAHLAGVAVLVLGMAIGALALDVAVGEEHALDRIIELLDRPCVDEAGGLQPPIHVLR